MLSDDEDLGFFEDDGLDDEDVEAWDDEPRACVRLLNHVGCNDASAVLRAMTCGKRRLELNGSWHCFKSFIGGKQWGHLEGLSLARCGLTAEDLSDLCSKLPARVTAFGVSSNLCVSLEAWKALWCALHEGIVELDFGMNKFDDKALRALSNTFLKPRGSSLVELRLDGNKIKSLEGLGAVLTCMPQLSMLDLTENLIDDDGLQELCDCLPGKSIQQLRLSENPGITSIGAVSLFGILPETPSLKLLKLDGTSIGDEGLEALRPNLSTCKLKELFLEGTKVTDAGLVGLMAGIRGSQLRRLHLGEGDFSEETLLALSEALESIVKKSKKKRTMEFFSCVVPQAAQVRAFLQRRGYGRIPRFLEKSKAHLADEFEYITTLPHSGKSTKKHVVHLMTEEEKVMSVQALEQRMQQVKQQYMAIAGLHQSQGLQARVKEHYEMEINNIQAGIAEMGREYIFVAAN
eukprot:gnl/MRDRNA2_/MRDRNA2_103726_c0_seq1.p1 gnl/MRDRNA2_/MRDRNA2_103726_c0~~gnl/MRDRNA2_/MRDRNA2_103726_c0_seq1.p1  ORF type:complete len:498 (+),score=95.70 gnl/MRDRNA2_/MRDRNA2_103726_c0_seq1:112-1494(+)